MNRKELMRDYWRYYKTLEDRLISTVSYIEIHQDNFTAFSNEYALLLQAIGAELDNFFKVYCSFNPTDYKNIADYANSILTSYPDIVNQIVTIPDRDIELQPFAGWDVSCAKQSLTWWLAFDDIKHNRAGNVRLANQQNVLNIIAALYLLEMKYCGIICEKDSNGKVTEPDLPDDNSKLFELKNWNSSFMPMKHFFFQKVEDE